MNSQIFMIYYSEIILFNNEIILEMVFKIAKIFEFD